jgi:beta-glucoside operon transcriptional antiterminator
MEAIKKINNNVALCVDGNNRELIAFGKGIGFPAMPYKVDVSLLSMTFYRIDKQFYDLINELPEDVLEVSALIVKKALNTLGCNLNPNLVISLADHINFAIIRMKKYKNIKMLFSYDVEQLYPQETELGRYAVQLIQKKLLVTLTNSEITNIAMHFVNAEEEQVQQAGGQDVEAFISEIVDKIEKFFSINIDRSGFNYNRFAMHIRYYLKRIKDKEQFKDDNTVLIQLMKENYPQVYKCALEIGKFISEKYQSEITEDEILYLMMHIYRIVQNIILKD